jgi:hypothetical protein
MGLKNTDGGFKNFVPPNLGIFCATPRIPQLNTSFIERPNLTIRQGSADIFRRSIGHVRWKERLENQLELLRCYYNFVRPHRTSTFSVPFGTPLVNAPNQAAIGTRSSDGMDGPPPSGLA